jgi:hypothetical protein
VQGRQGPLLQRQPLVTRELREQACGRDAAMVSRTGPYQRGTARRLKRAETSDG